MEGAGHKCKKCGNTVDRTKVNSGHKATCEIVLEKPGRTSVIGLGGKPPVQIEQHSGPWRKQGGVYKNEVGLRVQNWQCQTAGCGRVSVQLSTAGEPTSVCPAIRKR